MDNYTPENLKDYCLDFKVHLSWLGRTIAHEAAREKKLPEGFTKWKIRDNTGWTVGHEAARSGCLPKKFHLWSLADNNGWSIFKEDAARRLLNS